MYFSCWECGWESSEIPGYETVMVDVQDIVQECDSHTNYTGHGKFQAHV